MNKKITALLTLIGLALMVAVPVSAGATVGGPVTTGLLKGTGGGTAPIVKAKWEMDSPYASLLGTDDLPTAGAQFMPPGAWNANMNYSVCAVVTDPNGASDIAGVYAEIFYPVDRKMHKAGDDIDNPTGGCGAFIEQNTLVKLTKDNGYNLFCNTIRTNNTNLPTFNSPYGYNEICAADGELMKETAYVYCDDKTLTWEDPAGMYKVRTYAQDKAGNISGYLENQFEYLPLTGFAADFTNVSYGEVLLNTDKKISGDKTFETAGNSLSPTIRNIGNTRLTMKIAQDDMGFGQSSGIWNVKFDARVGNKEADWSAKYNPFKFKELVTGGGTAPTSGQYLSLLEELDLSETEEMDFSILITKWLEPTSYSGYMWLDASPATWASCPTG